MPFVNIKPPEAALITYQMADIGHRITDLLVEYFPAAARPHTMFFFEEVKDGGYYRADGSSFCLPLIGPGNGGNLSLAHKTATRLAKEHYGV